MKLIFRTDDLLDRGSTALPVSMLTDTLSTGQVRGVNSRRGRWLVVIAIPDVLILALAHERVNKKCRPPVRGAGS